MENSHATALVVASIFTTHIEWVAEFTYPLLLSLVELSVVYLVLVTKVNETPTRQSWLRRRM